MKARLRCERRGQDGENEPEKPDHPISLRDSLRFSTGRGFRYTQGNQLLSKNKMVVTFRSFSLTSLDDRAAPLRPGQMNRAQLCSNFMCISHLGLVQTEYYWMSFSAVRRCNRRIA